MIDIDATTTPAFLIVRATTLDGERWLADRLEGEAASRLARPDALYVEHRFGPDLLLGAHNDGLTVALDGQIADAERAA